MKLLITEATESKILQILELVQTEVSDLHQLDQRLIDEVECDLANAERLDGDIYVY